MSYTSIWVQWGLTAISQTFFPSQFKLNGKFSGSHPNSYQCDCNKILHMPWQLCCHGLCKILLQWDGQDPNYSQTKCPWNSQCDWKIFGDMGPRCTNVSSNCSELKKSEKQRRYSNVYLFIKCSPICAISMPRYPSHATHIYLISIQFSPQRV